jgi:aspartate racemase
MTSSEKTVGVIGGMGPAATVEFLRRLIEAVPAKDDSDHLHVIVDNNPKIPSRIRALIEGAGDDPAPVLCQMAKQLEKAGANFLTIPCNTAHHYHAQIQKAVSIPILDVIALSAARLIDVLPKGGRAGLLASPALRRLGVFEKALAGSRVALVHLDEDGEAALLGVIRAVKAGERADRLVERYHAVARRLRDAGADVQLVACTELSLLPPPCGTYIDTLEVLVEETVSFARATSTRSLGIE